MIKMETLRAHLGEQSRVDMAGGVVLACELLDELTRGRPETPVRELIDAMLDYARDLDAQGLQRLATVMADVIAYEPRDAASGEPL